MLPPCCHRRFCADPSENSDRRYGAPGLRILLVEVRGFEPLTPAVRRQCSTGLSYTPRDPAKRSRGFWADLRQPSEGGGGGGAGGEGGGAGGDGESPAAGVGSPAAPAASRGPTMRSANRSPIALSSGRQNAWKFMRRFCLVGLENLPQFHSFASDCRSLIVTESRGSAQASPLGREVQNEAFMRIQPPVRERHVVVAHAEDQEAHETEEALGPERVRPRDAVGTAQHLLTRLEHRGERLVELLLDRLFPNGHVQSSFSSTSRRCRSSAS